jgi:hypothetical protein
MNTRTAHIVLLVLAIVAFLVDVFDPSLANVRWEGAGLLLWAASQLVLA